MKKNNSKQSVLLASGVPDPDQGCLKKRAQRKGKTQPKDR
jgi:hypothetical protein